MSKFGGIGVPWASDGGGGDVVGCRKTVTGVFG